MIKNLVTSDIYLYNICVKCVVLYYGIAIH